MKKPLAKFVVTIPDTRANGFVLEDAGDTIAAADQIAEIIADLGYDIVQVKNFDD